MIASIERRFRQLRRWLSRSEWATWLLRLPRSDDPDTTTGLVMIQIDGLAHSQLTHALNNGAMPFLKKLLEREHYRSHHLYSGLPSSTPAVQGELFYGVKMAVPAFSFFDRETGEIRRMYEPASAAAVERRLLQQGDPLMRDGSVYCDIFTGGAAESHFCPASLGWGEMMRAANPIVLAALALTHSYSVVRIIALAGLEFILALIDGVRGVVLGHHLTHELKFVGTRVAICIILRELVTIGAKIDIARGLPIIHLNFLGFDEQAHRRGPDSRFAHWALKGIDDAVARVWRAARASARREYDVWIYSDHGQEHTEPYGNAFPQPVEQAIAAVFQEFEDSQSDVVGDTTQSIQSQRARLLGGGRRTHRIFPTPFGDNCDAHDRRLATQTTTAGAGTDAGSRNEHLRVAAMGPLGLIYYSQRFDEATVTRIARRLVDDAGLPIVLRLNKDNAVEAYTSRGQFTLPKDAAQVLGPNHPFLDEAADDLVALCQHTDAGEFVFCGWRHDAKPFTYPFENGSHAGPGSEETNAFALLPDDTVLPRRAQGYLRPLSLRQAAQHLLGRETLFDLQQAQCARAAANTLRVMTYNVHTCIGMDGKLSPQRIARVIARYGADVVCLQELDVGRSRTAGIDQAHTIAQYLEMDFHFHPAIHLEEERYGDAILTTLPMQLIKADKLPTLQRKLAPEPRGALWVAVELNGREVHIINTHLGLSPAERTLQVDALESDQWLTHPRCSGPVILCGDFNALPSSPVCQRLNMVLNDAQLDLDNHRPRNTFFGRYPTARIDHVYMSKQFEVQDIVVPNSKFAQVASDHLPLIVEATLAT